MKAISYISFILICLTSIVQGQTPGQIFYVPTDPGADAILDPNLDGWISGAGGFTAAVTGGSQDENTESEIDYQPLFSMGLEPTGDLQTGATCGVSEIVDNPAFPGSSAYYYYLDPDEVPDNGDESLLFRMRIADDGNGAYGYSFLIDTDNKIGADDPNSVAGNPGFEIEILYGSGNSGEVRAYLVDGFSAPASFTTLASYPNNSASRFQRSYVSNTNCGGSEDPIFIDFFIDYATILPYISGPLRIAFATSSSASSALGGSASDIGGVDDDAIANDDEGFINAIEAFPDSDFNFNGVVVLGKKEIYLNAESIDYGRVLINWLANFDSEEEITVQRSEDAISWTDLTGLPASSANESYQQALYDETGMSDKVQYYRLITEDQDGKTIKSNTVSLIHKAIDDRIELFPNPASTMVNIRYESKGNQDETVVIYDNFGRSVMQTTLNESGITPIDVQNLPKGVFTIIVQSNNGQSFSKPFVKL